MFPVSPSVADPSTVFVGNVPVHDLSRLLQTLADVRASRDTYRELLQVALARLRVAEQRANRLATPTGPHSRPFGQARRAA